MSPSKDTNPKDAISGEKLPLHLVPATAIAYAAVAHYNGALKYQPWNWRKAGVRASVYVAAAKRHLDRWMEGEDFDEDRVPHLGAVLACINILIDAKEMGVLTDDRPSGGISETYRQLTETIKYLNERDRNDPASP